MPDPQPLTMLPERLDLPRGRSALPGEEVVASQRARILQAVTDEVAERGYHGVSVSGITSRARVSRSVFYDNFADRQDAFAEAHLAASEQLFGLIAHAVGEFSDGSWRAAHRAGVQAYLRGFETSPTYAVSFMVEIRSAGARLLAQRDATLDRHAAGLARFARRATVTDADVVVPDRLVLLGVVAASDELVARAIREATPGEPLALEPLLDPIVRIQSAVITG